jgi:hypothetical protein
MRRHLIFGRFGIRDRIDIPIADDELATPLPFVVSKGRLEHDIGSSLDTLAKLGVFPSEIGVDLLVLAAHVQAADTRISRDTESQDSWTREIRIVVPVSDPARWISAIPLLRRLFNFLTGDRWTIGFRPRPAGFEQTVPKELPELIPPRFDSLALFSGGLDSLIGSIDSLEQGQTPLLISHAGDGATSDAQNNLLHSLEKNYPDRNFDRLRVWMDFRGWAIRGVNSEKTTRGRSFLFFAAGVFAGTGVHGSFTVSVDSSPSGRTDECADCARLCPHSFLWTHDCVRFEDYRLASVFSLMFHGRSSSMRFTG